MTEVSITELKKEFIDYFDECGHGDGVTFHVTLRFDCYGYDAGKKAVVREFSFDRIADRDGFTIYSSCGYNTTRIEASEWKMFFDFVSAKVAEQWDELEPVALASEPVDSYFDEEGFYDVF